MKDLVFILSALLEASRQKAAVEPTPACPPSEEWSSSADRYVDLCSSEGCLPSMSPEVATALIPRIVAVIPQAEKIARTLDEELEREATGGEVLKRLLLTEWHSGLREEWMRGRM